MSHPWKSKGEKRTLMWSYKPSDEVTRYLRDMQDAIKYSLRIAYRDTVRDEKGALPSPIELRKEIRDWFYSRYNYARHHANPVCRATVAMLRSYRKNHHGEVRIPEVKRLAMRIDAELFKIVDENIRITLQPNQYAWIPINTSNKHYGEYRGRPSELLITDGKVCMTFATSDGESLASRFVASDLNFNTIDSSKAVRTESTVRLEGIETESIKRLSQTQKDFEEKKDDPASCEEFEEENTEVETDEG